MMPSFYSNALPRHMPPTPPNHDDCSLGYAVNARQLRTPNLLSQSNLGIDQALGVSEPGEARQHYAWYNPAIKQGLSFSQENLCQTSSSRVSPRQGYPYTCERATGRLLPPIKVADPYLIDHPQHTQLNAQAMTQPKEEKATGGVAAHLDYEMQEMVDFVSDTAQGMYDMYGSRICLADIDLPRSVIDSGTPVSTGFRKFVSQMLSSTRLPSSTILVGLHYLSRRMTLLSINGDFRYCKGSLPRMLTTALLLGSKFLDDNTFQNRSWSEVSNIPVSELNMLEVEWLAAIQWNLHVHPSDPEGFLLWHHKWQRHQSNRSAHVETIDHPLEHNCLHKNTFHSSLPSSHQVPSYAGSPLGNHLEERSQWTVARYDSWAPLHSNMDYSPPSAPETGPNTPKWAGPQRAFGLSRVSHQMYQTMKVSAPSQLTGINHLQPMHHIPYTQQYTPYNHGFACPCVYCLSYREPCSISHGYELQSVVG